MLFGRATVFFAAAIRHRLPTTRLVERIFDFNVQPLQKLERGDADFWIEDVDVTRNHQGNLHVLFHA
jgi:hypothetical protein